MEKSKDFVIKIICKSAFEYMNIYDDKQIITCNFGQ